MLNQSLGQTQNNESEITYGHPITGLDEIQLSSELKNLKF